MGPNADQVDIQANTDRLIRLQKKTETIKLTKALELLSSPKAQTPS